MRVLSLAAVAALALVIVFTGAANAQVPYIAAYFNNTYSNEATLCSNSCPGVGVIGTLWVALGNANTFVSGVEFMITYPPQIMFLGDMGTQPVTVGNTAAGISMSWALPQNGFSPVPICMVRFMWNCDYCPVANIPIVVVQNPFTMFLGYTDFPNFTPHNAVGLTALICATVPAEETTWGQVKSLYTE